MRRIKEKRTLKTKKIIKSFPLINILKKKKGRRNEASRKFTILYIKAYNEKNVI